jgi:hypothetical protein
MHEASVGSRPVGYMFAYGWWRVSCGFVPKRIKYQKNILLGLMIMMGFKKKGRGDMAAGYRRAQARHNGV